LTLWDLLAALRRRWWAALAGVCLTGMLAVHVVHLGGVYHQEVNVVFVWPQGPRTSNAFLHGDQTLVSTAGLVGRIVAGDSPDAQVVSDTVTLVGEGIRHGYLVRLPNSGGQWALNFDRPVLDVQAAGSTPQEVQQTIKTVVARINHELDAIQTAARVPPGVRITTRMSPPSPILLYGKGSRMRALAVTLLLGTGLTVGVVAALDRWIAVRAGQRLMDGWRRQGRSPADLDEPVPVHQVADS
jgi:hypothetical protein